MVVAGSSAHMPDSCHRLPRHHECPLADFSALFEWPVPLTLAGRFGHFAGLDECRLPGLSNSKLPLDLVQCRPYVLGS